jgi:hypothetical protein
MTIEIRLKRKHFPIRGGQPGMVFLGKKQKGGHNNQGNKGALRKARPPMPKGHMDEQHAITEANQTYLVLLPSMKRRRMTGEEYWAWRKERDAG